jgi:hypothetical protein
MVHSTWSVLLHLQQVRPRPLVHANRMKFVAGVLTLACASGGPVVAKPVLAPSIVTAECYSLAYSDPVKNASASLFPTWIELFPGTDSGSVAGRPHPDYAYGWPAMTKYSWWKRIAGDSIEVNFSGNYEALHIHVQRVGPRLIGRAIYLSDVIVGGPDPSMRAEATREACRAP